jgi:hypothetical protein
MFDPWSYAEKYKSEHANQVSLMMWANMASKFGLKAANDPTSYQIAGVASGFLVSHGDMVPQLKWLHAIHNQGHGDAIRGSKAKAEGVKAGVFDIFLPVPMRAVRSDEYSPIWKCGLYLELKVGKNQMSGIQAEFCADMERNGYATCCAWGWLEARDHILKYLGIGA